MGLAGRFLTILVLSVGAASSTSAQECDDRLKALVASFPVIGTPSGTYDTSTAAIDPSFGYAGAFGTALPVNVSLQQFRAARGYGALVHADRDSYEAWTKKQKEREQLLKAASAFGGPPPYSLAMGEDYLARTVETLRARRAALGDSHPYVQEWLRNQRRAQAACTSQTGNCENLPRLEGTYDGALQQLAEADVRYQEATAFMFGYRPSEAFDRFRAIAERKDDPWRAVASMQAVRALLLNVYGREPSTTERAQQAEQLTHRILADPSLLTIHPWADRQLDVIAYQSGEPALLDDQLQRLMKAVSANIGTPDWTDAAAGQLALQLEYFLTPEIREPRGYWLRPTPAANARSEALRHLVDKWPLLDWLQADAAANWSRSLTWRNTALGQPDDPLPEHAWSRIDSDSVLWIRPYALRAPADDTSRERLWQLYQRAEDMADRCDMPIEWAAVYDRLVEGVVRVSLFANPDRVDEVLKRAKLLPAKRRLEITELARQTALIAGRMDLAWRWAVHLGGATTAVDVYIARDVGELVTAVEHMKNIGRPPTPRTYPLPTAQLGSRQAEALLALLPTSALLDAADRFEKPHPLRDALIRTAWLRAWLLEDRPLLRWASAKLSALDPALARDLRDADATWTRSSADQIRLLMVLRNPALTMRVFYDDGTTFRSSAKPRQKPGEPDATHSNDGNWWCQSNLDAAREAILRDTWFSATDWIEGASIEPLYRWAATSAPLLGLVDQKELDRLAAIPSAPETLTNRTLAWARSVSWFDRLMGWDRDVPEALHLAVRVTRWACRSDRVPHGPSSRRAYAILHRDYPDSEWARKTKYWYGALKANDYPVYYRPEIRPYYRPPYSSSN
jgi:hypothetical protein